MAKKERTGRGFRIFGRFKDVNGDEYRVQESSLAGEGAHVRITNETGCCVDFPGNNTGWHPHRASREQHQYPEPHLSVKQAETLVHALQTFILEARTNKLTEGVGHG